MRQRLDGVEKAEAWGKTDTAVAALTSRLNDLEERNRALESELRGANERLQAGAPARESIERELASLREERARLEAELKAARRDADANARILAENAELRRRMDEVADDILRFAETNRAAAAPPG